MPKTGTRMKHQIFSLTLAALLLTGCGSMVVNPVTGESERSVMSEEAEVAEGLKRLDAACAELTAAAKAA